MYRCVYSEVKCGVWGRGISSVVCGGERYLGMCVHEIVIVYWSGGVLIKTECSAAVQLGLRFPFCIY